VSGIDEAMSSPHLRRVVQEIQEYLGENLHRDINLRAIAREASLSPYYFSRAFTACVGVPPYRYLIGLRIARAKQLLAATDLTITQICSRVGFRNLPHFTTTFRRHTGSTPTDYRRRRDWEEDARRFSPGTAPLVIQPDRRLMR
jgi:AraC family transcriptional regulator